MRWFISSLTNGMEEHRKAAESAIRYLREHRGFDIISFRIEEDYPTPSNEPQDNYIKELEQSDAVLLILGEKYGNIIESYGISATHREFKRAVKTGKLIVLFYDSHKNDYDPEQLNLLHEAFQVAQGYKYDGTYQNLETQVQRVIEGVYRGSTERNPLKAERDGLDFASKLNLSPIAIFSSKLSTHISLNREFESTMKYNSLWLDLLSLSSKHCVSRNYFESLYEERGQFYSMGRLYDNGEVLFVAIQPFITYNFDETLGHIPKYSRNIEPNFLQQKISKFTVFISSYARNYGHVGPIKLNLTLNSNEPMHLNSNMNPLTNAVQTLMGNQVNHQSEHNTEPFSWNLNTNDQTNEALIKTRDQLLPELYRAFHYSEPELCEPFNKL